MAKPYAFRLYASKDDSFNSIGSAQKCGTPTKRHPADRENVMSAILNNAATIVAGLVFLVLVGGLLNMLRTNSQSTSQKLMRWRVGLQFLAIVLVFISAMIAKYA